MSRLIGLQFLKQKYGNSVFDEFCKNLYYNNMK